LDKNVKANEMRAIVRKRQQRKLVETNKRELVFAVRENVVEPEKVDRWMRRNKIPESIPYAPSPDACKRASTVCITVHILNMPQLLHPTFGAGPYPKELLLFQVLHLLP
jgi:hypothetical protein